MDPLLLQHLIAMELRLLQQLTVMELLPLQQLTAMELLPRQQLTAMEPLQLHQWTTMNLLTLQQLTAMESLQLQHLTAMDPLLLQHQITMKIITLQQNLFQLLTAMVFQLVHFQKAMELHCQLVQHLMEFLLSAVKAMALHHLQLKVQQRLIRSPQSKLISVTALHLEHLLKFTDLL